MTEKQHREEVSSDEPSTRSNPERDAARRETSSEPNPRELERAEERALAGRDPAGVDNGRGEPGTGPQPDEGQLVVQQQYYRSAPLPEPSEMAGYESVLPGAADRIMKMAEDAQRHRIKTEHHASVAESGAFLLSAIAASYFPWVALVGGILLYFLTDATAAAGVIAAIGVASGAMPQILRIIRPSKK